MGPADERQERSAARARAPRSLVWGAIALAEVPALLIVLLLMRAVWDVDIFWQLRLGELIMAHHGPLAHEPFAAARLHDSLPAIAWLGQVVMAAVRMAGGWAALRGFDALCWMGGFLAVAAACRARGAHPGAVCLGIVTGFIAALPTASVRPQSFAVLGIGLLLALLRLELRPLRALLLGTLLLVAWQNLHPSVSIAAVVLGAHAAAGWFGWWRDRTRPRPLVATLLLPVAVAAMFCTPDGFSILAVSMRNAQASLAVGATEWMPLWAPSNWSNTKPILLVIVLAAIFAWRGTRRFDAGELLAMLALFAMTVASIRIVTFWAVALVPVVARSAAREPEMPSPVPRWLAVVMPLLAASLGPVLIPTRFDSFLPLAAIERLKQEKVVGTIYADFPYGGPIIDAGYPAWHVAFDGRYYRYTPEEWHFNGDVEGGYLHLQDVLDRYHPAAFILKRTHNGALASDLDRDRRWRVLWTDGDVVVFVRVRRPASWPRL